MKVGESFDCPHCGKSSFLKKESVMDGWTKTGEVLACAACSAEIEKIEPLADGTPVRKEKISGLEALLGEKQTEKPRLESSDDEKHFCRDCENYISHPFMDRCSLHEKNVNPMDDCPDFKKR